MRYHLCRFLTTAICNTPLKKREISPSMYEIQKLSTNIHKYLRPLTLTQFARKTAPMITVWPHRIADVHLYQKNDPEQAQASRIPQVYLKYTQIPKASHIPPNTSSVPQEYPQVYLKYTQIRLKLLHTQPHRFYLRYRPPNHLNPSLIQIKKSSI